MRALLFAAMSCLAAGAALAQVSTAWVNAPGGVSIALDAADQVYTAHWEYAPAGDITLSKRSPAGSLLWQARFDNTDPTRHEVATWLATDSAGNALVSGTIRSGYSNPVNANALLMKFSPRGQLLWRRVYDSPFDGSSTTRVLVDSDDSIYVLGLGSGPNGQVSMLRKFAPDGSTLWTWFDSLGIGAPMNLKWTPERQLLVVARGITGALNGYARVDRGGQTVWVVAGVPSLTVGDAAGEAGGNTYRVDGDTTPGATGSVLSKVAPGGTPLWQRRLPIAGLRVEVPADQGAIVSGYPNSGSAGAAFMRLAADGSERWRNLDADGPGYALLLHAQMKLDGADNAYLAAGTLGQMAVARVNADGSSGWTAAVPSGNTYAIALGSDNAVHAVGGNTAKFIQGAPPPPLDADLQLSMSDAPDPVRVGSDLVYTLTLTNRGPAVATAVTLQDSLAKSLGFVSAVPAQGSCSGAPALSCSLGSLNVGSVVNVAITVRPKLRGVVVNTASAGAAQPDPTPADNSASISTQVLPRR